MGTLAERVWAKVDKTETCWVYGGFCDPRGYGIISEGSGPHRNKRVHRLVWEWTYGQIPVGHMVCHRCDVRNCVNPAHLFTGLAKDNTGDMVQKGRGAFQKDPTYWWRPGSAHGQAKLTEAQVVEMRQLRTQGIRQWELAQRFGVTRGMVGHIVRRDAWTHV